MIVVLASLAFTACDETSEGVRQNYVDRQRDGFVYEGTTHDHVVNALRTLFSDYGYTVTAGDSPGSFITSTHNKGAGRWFEHYRIRIVDLRWRTGFTVEILHLEHGKDGNDPTTYRDDNLEWELIQRADPDRAVDIMAKANAKADKVPARVHSNHTEK